MRPGALFRRAVLTAALPLLACGAAAAEPAITIGTIGTGSPAGVYHEAGRAICELTDVAVSEGGASDGGAGCEPRASDGSIANLRDLRAGQLQFAIVQSDWQYHAVNGSDRFAEDKADSSLRAMFALHGEPFLLVARRDAGIRRLPDLAGKRVNIGNPGSGQRATMEIVMRQMGWERASFPLVEELSPAQQSLALCNGRIQAMVYVVGIPNDSLGQAMRLCDAVIIEVAGRPIDILTAKYPFYAAMTVPGGLYAGNPRDVHTFGVTATVVTSASVDADTVYAVTKAVFENLDALRHRHPAFRHLNPRRMIAEGLTAPLHEGARRYYRERGWL
jgi:uncharacterized protein